MSKWGHLGMVMCLLLSTPAWASIGKVSLLKGEATASRNNQSIELMNGTNIEEHDFIATRANSQIQLTFEDKTVITLGSESTLDIQDYLNDANNPKAKFKFNQGTFKTITGQIGKKAPENFNLETKTATIGIRGTIIGGIVTSGSIFCLSGTITVAPLGMPNIINVVPTGQVIHVRTPDARQPPQHHLQLLSYNNSIKTLVEHYHHKVIMSNKMEETTHHRHLLHPMEQNKQPKPNNKPLS